MKSSVLLWLVIEDASSHTYERVGCEGSQSLSNCPPAIEQPSSFLGQLFSQAEATLLDVAVAGNRTLIDKTLALTAKGGWPLSWHDSGEIHSSAILPI